MSASLRQVAPFVVALVILAVVIRKRRFSLTRDLRMVWPPWGIALLWIAGWAVMVAGFEVANRLYGDYEIDGWSGKYGVAAMVVRGAGVAVLAPVVEELVFRGLLLPRLAKTRLGAAGAVVVIAALFAGLHFQYDALTLIPIFADGVVYGAARLRTDSLLLPMSMHAIGNTYALIERLLG